MTHHLLDEWLAKARHARRIPADQPYPAWSTTELLAVSLILNDTDQLTVMDYTRAEALDRLRHEIEAPTIDAANTAFEALSRQL